MKVQHHILLHQTSETCNEAATSSIIVFELFSEGAKLKSLPENYLS
jgi:hypothetical protein